MDTWLGCCSSVVVAVSRSSARVVLRSILTAMECRNYWMGANNCCNASWADPGLHRQSPLAYTSLLLWPLLLFLWVSAPDCSTCSHYNSSWFSFSVCFSLSWPFLILLLSLHSPSSLPNSLGLCKLTEKGK